MGQRGAPHDPQTMTVAAATGDPSHEIRGCRPTSPRWQRLAGIENRHPYPAADPGRLDDDPRTAVFDRVENEIVERLQHSAAIAVNDRVTRQPAQLEPAANETGPPAPAGNRRLQQRPYPERRPRISRRAAVDLTIESLQRRGGELHGLLDLRRLAVPRAG